MEIIKRSEPSNPTTPIDNGDNRIPDWLLFEILLRLPINSVLQYRAVSKQWLSVASDPHFIRAYSSQAASFSRPPSMVLPQLVNLKKFLPSFVHNPPRSILQEAEILGVSDDGLVLYCTSTGYLKIDLYVCNPITRYRTEPISLQLAAYYHTHHGWGFLTRVDGESTLKSYRIVQAVVRPTVTILNVYYSETGEWKEFTVDERPRALQKSAAVLDGILYWANTSGGGVIAYDPEAKPERVRIVRDPRDGERPYDNLYSCTCVVCGGELRYFAGYWRSYSGLPTFSIWKLEDSLSGEWCLVHKVEESVMYTEMKLEIVCFDPFDSDVVYLIRICKRSSVLSYNLKSGTLDDYRGEMIVNEEYFGFRRYSFPWNHVLVLPPWPTRVAEKQLDRH